MGKSIDNRRQSAGLLFRLGYGKGFYDRYLSEFKGSRIGIVYSDYIMPTVPRGRFDVSVDILLTENGVKTVKK